MNEYEEYLATKSLAEIMEILSSIDAEKHKDRYLIAKARYDLLRKQRGRPRNDYLVFQNRINSLTVAYQDLEDLCTIKINGFGIFPIKIQIQFNNTKYTFGKRPPLFGPIICKQDRITITKSMGFGDSPKDILFKLNNDSYRFHDNSKLTSKIIDVSRSSKTIGGLVEEDELHNLYKVKFDPSVSDLEFVIVLGYLIYSLYSQNANYSGGGN
jgi:hypothetical protein